LADAPGRPPTGVAPTIGRWPRSNDGSVLWSGVVDTGPYTGFPGGAFAAQTDIGDCSQVPNTSNNDYAIAYDTVSGRWSNQVPVDSSCASL
jgi:hypothetical protein